MDPCWRTLLHDPTPPAHLPQYLQTVVDAALTAISPSLFADAAPSSVLLIGTPASGKTLVSKRILHHLDEEATNHSKSLKRLTLTGLLHSTPIRAWRHIAITLSSHIHSDSESFATATVQQCLAAIAHIFKVFRADRTPLVIILDHFDRFITTTDGMSQTVLYSLLNFLQDRHMRIACIAMTSSIDVTDSLEKRVKSRFQHRQLVVPLPDKPAEITNWLLQILLQPQKEQTRPESKSKKRSKSKSKAKSRSKSKSTPAINPTNPTIVRSFLEHPRCTKAIRKSMLRTRTVAPILQALDAALPAALHQTPNKDLNTKVEHACTIFEDILTPRDPIADILHNLTELEIALLVALRKLVARIEKQDEKITITFSDVFKHYESATVEEGFSTTKDTDRLVERGVAEKSWERLVECGAVVRLGNGPREMRGCVLGVHGEDVDRALQKHAVAASMWKNWGKKR